MKGKDSRFLITLLAGVSLAFAGCSHQPAKTQAAAPESPPAVAAAPTQPTEPIPPTQAAEPVVRNDVLSGISDLAPVHFEFDSDIITADNGAILRKNADWLGAHQGLAIQVAGRCDQRGTVEYNLALGQRRADAVRKYYEVLGVPGARIATISYGKEEPSCAEDTEDCWSQNRTAQTLEAVPMSISSVYSQWPNMAQLAARVMIEKYGPPQIISSDLLRWQAAQPWKTITVRSDANAPLEQSIAYDAPAGKLAALYKFGHGLSVRPDDGVLAASGDSEAHNILALNLANDIATGKMTPAQAERFYAKTIDLEVSGKSSSYTQRLQF